MVPARINYRFNWGGPAISSSCLLRRGNCAPLGKDDVDLEPDKLFGDLALAIALTLRLPIGDGQGAPIDPTEFQHTGAAA
jgi:hypothetical protein